MAIFAFEFAFCDYMGTLSAWNVWSVIDAVEFVLRLP